MFDVFSKRNMALPDPFIYDTLPEKLRNQLFLLFKAPLERMKKYDWQFLELIVRIVSEEHGRFALTDFQHEAILRGYERSNSADSEIFQCLTQHKSVPLVLDLIEVTLRILGHEKDGIRPIDEVFHDPNKMEQIVDEVNHRFRENAVGYQFNLDLKQLIRIDSTLLHESVVKPVLHLLTSSKFAAANTEFAKAFEDYRKGDNSDCVVKSCAAYESVLKVICAENGLLSDTTKATCGELVQAVAGASKVEGFLSEPLKLIGSIRNKKSIAHGGGTVVKDVSGALAGYCLHATAASILYVVESFQ